MGDFSGHGSTPDPDRAPRAAYDPSEQEVVLAVFTRLLRGVTRDGGRKRAAGLKPPWWQDTSHKPAIFSHLMRRERGELIDPDSGAHPYVHLAWRALAIAYQETYGQVDPEEWLARGEA